MTSLVFACGLIAGVTLDLLLLRTLLAPPFRIWPTPGARQLAEPDLLESVPRRMARDLRRRRARLELARRCSIGPASSPVCRSGLIGLFITVCGYFNLGLGNTYCGADGLVTGGLYRFSRNPQYTASIVGLIGLSIGANSIFTIVLVHV